MAKKLKKQKKEDNKFFSCDKCSKKYTNFLALEKHKIDKHPERPTCRYVWKVSSSFLNFSWPDVKHENIVGLVQQTVDIIANPSFEGDITIRRVRTGDC